jgi:hypothetical protein
MKNLRMTLTLFFCVCLLVLIAFAIGVWRFEGVKPFVAYLNGEVVYFDQKTLDIGECEAGARTVAVFRMTNLSSKEIAIVGEQSGCNCAFAEQIPIVAAPGTTVDVRIGVHLPLYETTYDQTVLLMVAEPTRLAMHPVRITAMVSNPISRPIEDSESAAPLLAPLIPTRIKD